MIASLPPVPVRRLRRRPQGRLAGAGVPLWYPLPGSGAEGQDGLEVGDPAALFADPALARAELGWQPVESDLDGIVGSAWAWHSSLVDTLHPATHQHPEVRLAV